MVPLVMITVAIGIIVLTVMGRRGSMKGYYQQKRRLREWRKQHGLPLDTPVEGPPPMPMHVETKIGDPGIPYQGIGTKDADNFLAAIRRWFTSKPKDSEPD